MSLPRWFAGAMPFVFVLLWSTGFIGAKFGLPYAAPFTFLLYRFLIVAAILALVAKITGAQWPRDPRQILHIVVSGLMIHGVYLGGVFASIGAGLPSWLSSLICGLQPLLTGAVAGLVLGEHVRTRQWAGLLLGLVGVAIVLSEKALPSIGGHLEFGLDALLLSVLALIGITGGTLYQKRFSTGMDLRTGSALQFAASALALLPLAWAEGFRADWSLEFSGAMAWLVLVLSIGAISLLMVMIRLGEASRVASFFYLVPPVTAIEAHFLFGETLGPLSLAGMAVVAVGVALVVARNATPAPTRDSPSGA